jgi:hypothetical protein
LVTAFLSLSCAEQTLDTDIAATDVTKKFGKWIEGFDDGNSV